MKMKMLTADEARCWTSCTEDILDVVCNGCVHNTNGPNFCPIQAQYGMRGEHPEIVGRRWGKGLRVACLKMKLPSRKKDVAAAPTYTQCNLFESRP